MFSLFAIAFLIALCNAQNPMIPGNDMIGVGWNAVTNTLAGLPIIELTWNKKRTYTNPIYSNLVYDVPDQFYVNNDIQSLLVDGTMSFTNISDYQKQVYKKETKHGFFSSKSKTTIDYYHEYFEYDNNLALTYQFHGWFKITLPPLPPPKMHPRTLAIINKLPAYDTNRNSDSFLLYREFIESFGTHYMDSAVMGGMLKMTSWFQKCFLKKFGYNYVAQQSGWSFLGIVGDGKGKVSTKGKGEALWQENSKNQVLLHGGDNTLIDPVDYVSWIDTIKNNPAPIFYTFQPITGLIADATKRAWVDQAIGDYFRDANIFDQKLQQDLTPKQPHSPPPWCV